MKTRAMHALILGVLLAAAPRPARAVRPPNGDGEGALEVVSGEASRQERRLTWQAPKGAAAALARFSALEGGRWRAYFDHDTAVPGRLYGSGIAAPGAVHDPQAALRAAERVLRDHLALLAPGVQSADFVLVSNDLDAESGIRTVGFSQRHLGLEVLGGQLSFRFKDDRLFVIASEALPHVAVAPIEALVPRGRAERIALDWIAEDAGQVSVRGRPGAPLVLPIVGRTGAVRFHRVVEVTIDALEPVGRFAVYLDAGTGARVARRQTLLFADGTVLFNTPERRPGGARRDGPAAFARVASGGQTLSTDASGAFSWPGEDPIEATAAPTGPAVRVINDAGERATADFTLAPGGTFVWDTRGEELADAQLTTFVAATRAKDFVKALAPGMAWLFDEALVATVNMGDTCNAFSDGTAIFFFRASNQCENTGRLPDVVYHEFGHTFHAHALVPGAGSFDTSLSEGASDYLAATITGDPGMGRGFFYTDAALRHVDPPNREAVWPDDISEPHITGLIFAGAMWDLRKALSSAAPTPEEGIRITDGLFYQTLRRASDIPSSYVEVLAADDDDGDLSNGTPNACAITEAFARHGLADPEAAIVPIGKPRYEGGLVRLDVDNGAARCPGAAVREVRLEWRVRGDDAGSHELVMREVSGGYEALLPEPPAGTVLEYRVSIALDGGNALELPDNPADPWYEVFVGDVVELYCTDFERDPASEGWSHELLAGEAREGADDWQHGPPRGTAGSGDPSEAHSGASAIGNDLGGGSYNGKYQPGKVNVMRAPPIDLGPHTNVHLQYRRWLSVEDGFFDQATILVSGREAWRNLDGGQGGDTHHVDKEWRFHDVDLSGLIEGGTVEISFQIASDDGLELGGWTIDDFCVVALPPVVEPARGNGAEDQDSAPSSAPGDPEPSCEGPECAPEDSAPTADPKDLPSADLDAGCGCTAAGRTPASAALVLLFCLLGLLRRAIARA